MQKSLVGQNIRSNKTDRGFTIVELLIVVVVIAILAAITIVAFNGVTQRAKDTAAQSAAAQGSKKLATYAPLNSDAYPADKASFLTATSLSDGDGTGASPNYQYTASSDRRSYCLTTTVNNISYYTTNTAQNPQKGACPGHGLNNGGVVTNYVLNPKLSVDAAGWTVGAGSGGAAGLTRTATGGPSGVASSFARSEWTAASTSPGAISVGQSISLGAPVTAGATYTPSLYVRSSAAMNVYVDSIVYSASGTVLHDSSQTTASLPADTWTRIQGLSYVAPSGAATASVRLVTGSAGVAAGVKIDTTAAMLNMGTDVPAYADGDTTGWVWNGTVNASTSTGPAQ